MRLDPVARTDALERQAALLLHGMTPADRTWLLDQLPLAQQEVLSGLLAELAELGVPADPAFVREAVTELSSPEQTAWAPARALDRLEPEQLQQLAESLRHEPPMLTARLLAAGSWPWSAELLAGMDAARRRAIEAGLRTLEGARDPGRLSMAVVDAVTRQLWPSAQDAA